MPQGANAVALDNMETDRAAFGVRTINDKFPLWQCAMAALSRAIRAIRCVV